MKRYRAVVCGVLLGALTGVAGADDTDIYINQNEAGAGGQALVMLILDWRPNLGSTVCTNDIEVEDPDNPGSTLTVNECEHIFAPYMPPIGEDGKYVFIEELIAAIKKVVTPLTGIRLGLMLNHDDSTGSCNGLVGPAYGNDPPQGGKYCSDGGFVLIGFKDMDDPVESAVFWEKLANIPIPDGNQSHKYQGKQIYFEFFRYLTGQQVHNGHVGWDDYGTQKESDGGAPHYNIDNPLDTLPHDEATGSWDPDAEDGGGNYRSPLHGLGECSSASVINFMHQVSQQEDESDDHIEAPLVEGGMAISDAKVFEDVLSWFQDADLVSGITDSEGEDVSLPRIKSWFMVDSSHVANNTTDSYAEAGGTGPHALSLSEDPEELLENLANVFKQILSVSTTFVSPSVPVNVLNTAEALDEVYLSLFEPAADGTPRWAGNLKKVKVGEDANGDRVLVDALGNDAVAADGRLNHQALTFWTVAGELAAPGPTDEFVDGRDGRTVKRGAAGQMMPGYRPPASSQAGPGAANTSDDPANFTARRLYTEPDTYNNGTPVALMAFDADDATAAALIDGADGDRNPVAEGQLYDQGLEVACAVADCSALDADAEAAMARDGALELVKFGRGLDLDDEDGDTAVDDARLWLIGDGLHSRPVPINYGNAGDPDNPLVRVVFGANDGWFRMIRAEDGVEAWAFMPRAVMPELGRLRRNDAGIPVHPYGVDGEPMVMVVDNNHNGHVEAASPENDRVVVYFGLRRGGKTYYALDITDPDAPQMLWSIAAGDTGFEQLAQSWSLTRVGRVSVDVGGTVVSKLVLAFGGGYNGDDGSDGAGDLGKDERDLSDPPDGTFVGSDDNEGNAVFIVDALTGELVWKAVDTDVDGAVAGPRLDDARVYEHPDLEDSVPSTLSLLDTDGDGDVDRLYVGDTGGNVWRGDLAGSDRANWTLTRIARLGRHYSALSAHDRRFLHKPDFVQSSDSTGPYDGILIGSGDRANPLAKTTVDFFYLIKDRAIVSGSPPSEADVLDHSKLADLTDNCIAEQTVCSDLSAASNLVNGWKLKLEQCDGLASTGTCGEKVLTSPLVVNGIVLFNSYVPADLDANPCTPVEGGGLFYAVDLQNAGAEFNFIATNDVDGIVLDRFERLDAEGIPSQLVPIGNDGVLRGDLKIVTIPGWSSAKTFWYEEDRGGASTGF